MNQDTQLLVGSLREEVHFLRLLLFQDLRELLDLLNIFQMKVVWSQKMNLLIEYALFQEECAEQIFFQSVTTGAYDDLKKAYELCHQIVTKFGMSDVIGNVGYQESEYSKSYSDQTNKLIDDEIKKLIDEATERTKNLIEQYRPQIESLASALMEKETLDLKQIKQILGERPFPPKSTFKAYLETQQEIDKEENEKEERLKKEAQQKKQTQQNQGNQDNQNNEQKKEQSN
eukprot:TRINITY_DN3790_c0_g2_i3.p1 TRINITY_DN3790_c0_g2~~TRINITY_DN3790_c0_g2_i3.p1  ORF type:complete len:230 (-),score=45.31 TRINITY_DN3790_c0_g2_i3:230-919(-)